LSDGVARIFDRLIGWLGRRIDAIFPDHEFHGENVLGEDAANYAEQQRVCLDLLAQFRDVVLCASPWSRRRGGPPAAAASVRNTMSTCRA
jgi:hypothetical protein